MELNILGEIAIMKTLNLKPNYAELGRKYGMDWRTAKKYCNGYKGKPSKRSKPSKLDNYADEIYEKLKIHRLTVSGVYNFMVTKYGREQIGSPSNFRRYVKEKKLKPTAKTKGHPRVETSIGHQAQVDWKEEIRLISKYGEIVVLNIFHVVLSYSRFSFIEISFQKRSEDVYRGLINAFQDWGGVPKEILFDNMRTAANISGSHKKVNSSFAKFAKDFNFKVRLCKARNPQTKGTVEAKNKVLDWIRAYNHEFESIEELIEIVEEIKFKMNTQINQDIGLSPTALFYKEKEHLQPLPSKRIIETYLTPNRYIVSNEALIRYGGNRYSVDPELIGQQVTIETLDNKIYIYYNGKLVTLHQINENSINYHKNHYKSLMKGKVHEDDLTESVDRNLKAMDRLLESRRLEVTADKAVQSPEALIAYFSDTSSGRWIINRYSQMSKQERISFLKHVCNVLPYVASKNPFSDYLKELIKSNKLELIDLNCLIHDITSDSTKHLLTSDGYQLIFEKHKEKLDELMTKKNFLTKE